MKLRKTLKKFTSILLISLFVLSLMSCAKKEESDNDDKKEDKKQESTTDNKITDVDSLFDAVNSKSEISISEEDIKDIIEDNYLTYEEVQLIIEKFPSFTSGYSVVLDVDFEATMDDETESDSLKITFDAGFEYDSKTQSLHFSGIVEGMDEDETIDLWLINEDGTYYGYEKYGDTAYREELGSLEEFFGEDGLDLTEFLTEYHTMINDYSEVFGSFEDIDTEKYISEFREMFTLKEGTSDYNGNECYNLVMTCDLYDMFNKAKESDEFKDLLKEMDLDIDINEIDQYLDEELFEGYTINDIIKLVKFDVNYYVSTDFNYYSSKLDATKCVNNLLDVVEKVVEQEVVLSLNCNEISISMECELDADVDVTFDGEYEE